MTAIRTRAIVLRRTNYGEADRILQLMTPEGKRSVMARGVRREKSKLAGGIELFGVSDVVINEGKGELGILTSARLVHYYRHIIEDYDRLQFGYEVIKHINAASEMINEPEWFDVLFEVIKALDAKTLPLQLTQTWFYLHYADLLGLPLSLVNDINGQSLQSDMRYMYDISDKGLRPATNGELTADHIKLMRLIQAKPLDVLVQVGGTGGILPECWATARAHASL